MGLGRGPVPLLWWRPGDRFNTLLVNFALLAMLLAFYYGNHPVPLLGEAETVLVFAITYIGLFLLVEAVYHWAVKRKRNEASIAGLLFASLDYGQRLTSDRTSGQLCVTAETK